MWLLCMDGGKIMIIYRDGKVIQLTEQELDLACREAQRKYYESEVVAKLVEDYDVDPKSVDWMEIAEEVMDEIAEDDTHWECEQDAYRRVIKRHLKEGKDE